MNSNLESRSPHAILAALDMSPVTEFVIAAAVDVARMSGCVKLQRNLRVSPFVIDPAAISLGDPPVRVFRHPSPEACDE